MLRSFVVFLLSLLIFSQSLRAQDSISNTPKSQLNKKKLALVIGVHSAIYIGGIAYLAESWYKDDVPRVPFEFYNDNAGYLQIDKLGHAYGAYVESLLSYSALRNAGVKKKQALIFGGPMGLLLQTPIEVFDGLYEGWGFSKGDMIANAAGSALFIGNEILFDEQLIRYKFSYWHSKYARDANGYLGDNALQGLLYDYNGHTYWLSAGVNKIFFTTKFPPWLSLAAGYSANGMFGEFENLKSYRRVAIPETQRYRQFLLSPDIDWTKIPTKSKFLKALFKAMVFIKVPLPALELNNQGEMKAYWLYF